SGIGAEVTTTEGEWLYRLGQEVRGPLSEALISNKIANGEIPLTAQVAREGGEFHGVARVATFADAVRTAQKAIAKRRKQRLILLVGFGTVVLGAGIAGVSYVVLQEAEAKRLENQREAEARAAAMAAERASIEKSTKGPELLALVSLGTEEEVEIRKSPKKPKGRRPKGPKDPRIPDNAPEESFSSCQRSQSAILGVLQKHVARINVCVEDEKSRDAAALPATLKLDFVVQAAGSVTDFRILDRHYRTGPMNNCMIKVFRRVKYPSVSGSNCPVTIPIKIRG
ncbi:MAG: AgmX/PglI C-terminal domain-containing protein, partial [Myxococcota bacterium]